MRGSSQGTPNPSILHKHPPITPSPSHPPPEQRRSARGAPRVHERRKRRPRQPKRHWWRRRRRNGWPGRWPRARRRRGAEGRRPRRPRGPAPERRRRCCHGARKPGPPWRWRRWSQKSRPGRPCRHTAHQPRGRGGAPHELRGRGGAAHERRREGRDTGDCSRHNPSNGRICHLGRVSSARAAQERRHTNLTKALVVLVVGQAAHTRGAPLTRRTSSASALGLASTALLSSLGLATGLALLGGGLGARQRSCSRA